MLTWEIRSVNHRFLEMQFRLPEALRSVEYPLRDTLRKHLKRGKLDCALRMERQASESTIELNRPLLLQVLAMVEQVPRAWVRRLVGDSSEGTNHTKTKAAPELHFPMKELCCISNNIIQ